MWGPCGPGIFLDEEIYSYYSSIQYNFDYGLLDADLGFVHFYGSRDIQCVFNEHNFLCGTLCRLTPISLLLTDQ